MSSCANGSALTAERRRRALPRQTSRATELRANLAANRTPSFLEELRPLLRPGVAYDPAGALDRVEATLILLLR